MFRIQHAIATFVMLAALAACQRDSPPDDAAPTRPAEAVAQLAGDLRRNDLQAYARHALPPVLHARIEVAWREGRTIWPLTELPLNEQLPGFIAALAQPDAEQALTATYRRQFAGAHRELRSAAATLGLFATQYVRSEGDYSDAEREHYVQLVAALSQWGRQAPLGDLARAETAIAQWSAAARATGLTAPEAFATLGMDTSLERLGPVLGSFKQALVGYGLDLDATLDSVQTRLLEQTGETARVRLQYTLAGQPIDAIVHVERRDGRWYLTDLLRHAEIAAGPPATNPAAPVPPPVSPPVSPPLDPPTDTDPRAVAPPMVGATSG